MPRLDRIAFRPLPLAAALALLPTAPASAICVALVCANSVAVSNDTNQCGAVVNYGAPTQFVVGPGNCGTITCSPPSGSFFPIGTTQIDCSGSEAGSCSLDVTVFDTQPPTITAPENLTVAGADPGMPIPVEYLSPTTSDNCPGVTFVCDPPSGSVFPSGETIVTCTATDASGNTATASFALDYFDACVQDDASGEFLRWRTVDGVYEYIDCNDSACSAFGFQRTGTGEATPTPAGFQLRDEADGRSVRASIHTGKGKGKAGLKFRSGASRFSSKLKDASLADDTCSCLGM